MGSGVGAPSRPASSPAPRTHSSQRQVRNERRAPFGRDSRSRHRSPGCERARLQCRSLPSLSCEPWRHEPAHRTESTEGYVASGCSRRSAGGSTSACDHHARNVSAMFQGAHGPADCLCTYVSDADSPWEISSSSIPSPSKSPTAAPVPCIADSIASPIFVWTHVVPLRMKSLFEPGMLL